MIQVDGLSMAYQGVFLFKDAVFNIDEKERCVLVARNGFGKTTLFRILTGKETPDSGTIVTRKNYSIGALDQHIRFSEPTLIEEAALGLPKGEESCLYKVEKILFGLGFKEEDLYKSPEIFSGGYQLRLHLTKVLVSEPNCLLLDEPTNYLDIVSIRWFTRFLQAWKGEFVLISHDREFMDSVSTHTMGIHRQKVRKVKGSTVDFFEKIAQEEEIHEKTALNRDKKRAHLQSFIDRFGAKATKAVQAQSREKMLQRIPALEKLKALYQLEFAFNEAPFSAKKMIEVSDVCFAYTDTAPLVVDHLSLSIEKGERIAIVGKNGRGKSTALRLLTKDLKPLSGEIKASENVRIGYFGQTNIDRLHPSNTVEQEIAQSNSKLDYTQVKGICGLMMFSGDKSSKPISVLSGGERSRVLLGKIIASPCNLLLLDEPTHHLDIESIEALIDALEDFEGAIVIVTHSELILKRLEVDKIVVCHQGHQELFLGSYDEFLEKNGWHDKAEVQKPKKKNEDSREFKQQRADLINARSKALKPLELEIDRLEKRITALELEQHDAHLQLLDLTKATKGQAIQELSKAIAIRKNSIDDLYRQLEEVSSNHEKISGDFNGLLT